MAISTFEADEIVARANVNQRINQANAYFPVSVANGGTGQTSLTSGEILLGNGTSGISSTAILPQSKGGTGVSSFYSSGTWTPAIKQGASSYLTRRGMYYQIGDMVYVNFSVQVAGSSSYDLIVTGLPFTADSSENNGYAQYPLSVLYATGLSYNGYELAGRVGGNSIGIVFKNSMSAYAHFTEYLAQFALAGWYKRA